MFTNRREDLQRKTRSIPGSGRLSMAPETDKFRIPDQAKEPPDQRDTRDGIKSSLKITETFRVWTGSILKLC